MVINLGLLYLLLSFVLFVVAVIVHLRASSLSLPISSATTILLTLLPPAALLNAILHPPLARLASSRAAISTASPASTCARASTGNGGLVSRLTPTVLQLLQALLATVLATLLAQDMLPSPTARCLLGERWQDMFSRKDGDAVRRIQDALGCCGFNSEKDRAYPFPPSRGSCVDTFGPRGACAGPWAEALRGNAGAGFAVVVVVGMLQAFGLLVMRERPGWWAWRMGGMRRTAARGEGEGSSRENRPLLTTAAEDEEAEVVERQGQIEAGGYRALEGGEEETGGPRVQPSGMGHEHNAWSE